MSYQEVEKKCDLKTNNRGNEDEDHDCENTGKNEGACQDQDRYGEGDAKDQPEHQSDPDIFFYPVRQRRKCNRTENCPDQGIPPKCLKHRSRREYQCSRTERCNTGTDEAADEGLAAREGKPDTGCNKNQPDSSQHCHN